MNDARQICHFCACYCKQGILGAQAEWNHLRGNYIIGALVLGKHVWSGSKHVVSLTLSAPDFAAAIFFQVLDIGL